MVRHSAQSDVIQPPARVYRYAFARPLVRRGDQRFLDRVLGDRKLFVTTRDNGEHLRREIAKQMLDVVVPLRGTVSHASVLGARITCRTSTGMLIAAPPGPGADEAFAAISYARSGRSTS